MTTLFTIGWTTVLEAVREKVLYLLAAFGATLFFVSRLLAPLALGEGRRVTIDLGFFFLSLFGLLIVILLGHSVVQREIERGSVVFLFSRPVGRGQFILGKFIGMATIVAAAEMAMGLCLAAVCLSSGYPIGTLFFEGIAGLILSLWILAALGLLFASVASPSLASFFVGGAWVIGNTSGSLSDLAALLAAPGNKIAEGLLWLVPRLDLYNASTNLVHGIPIGTERWAAQAAYAALYSLGALLLARAAFARRSMAGN